MPWEEVTRAKAENRRELVLSGQALAARLASTGGDVDPALFDLAGLNFLDLGSCAELTRLPDAVGRLANLTTLLVSRDALGAVPGPALAKLAKLKVLDFSSNKLAAFPEEALSFENLSTLNLSMNLLSSLPSLEKMTALSHVDLSGNQLESLEFLCHPALIHLADVSLARNKVAEIPAKVSALAALKKLDLTGNLLKSVPGELADCLRMKELLLAENPLADNRLKKMVAQKGTKAVLDYIRQHCPKGNSGEGGGGGGGGKKGKGGKKAAKKAAAAAALQDEEDDADEVRDLLEVLQVAEGVPRVVSEDAVRETRPYVVCFVARDLDLSSKLKSFIQAQTRLHDTVCDRRNAATIATHDLAKIPEGPIAYTARPPAELKITPLGHAKESAGEALVAKLRADAEQQRKEKKRSAVSGIHQYLNLLKDKDAYACMVDGGGRVISFPPITNSEGTKISADTKDILVEVTSGSKLQLAKDAADALIREMLELDLGRRRDGSARSLVVEQMKVVDAEGNLKVVYPAKTDLPFAEATPGLVIKRPS